MTDREAIAAVRCGGRCTTSTTLFGGGQKPPVPQCWCVHNWRTVACDNETDVVECSKCGEQKLARCNFDEDFA